MKQYMMSFLCFVFLLHGNNQPLYQPIEWNVQDYANGNKTQEKAALQLLDEAKIDLVNKVVYDVGCRTGNISALMAQKAQRVHGFDSSLNMISWAYSHYGSIANLSFEQCRSEDFSPPIKSDIFTLFFCLHWIKDKKIVLQKCYDHLNYNGELLANVRTVENGPPLSLKVLQEILPDLQKIVPTLSDNVFHATGRFYLTHEQLTAMLQDIGFSQITLKTISLDFSFKNIDELIAFERPVMMSRPFMQDFDENTREEVFKIYIAKLLEKLEKNEDGYYVNQDAQTTMIHCYKL